MSGFPTFTFTTDADRAQAELEELRARLTAAEAERDKAIIAFKQQHAIVARIWVQLGSPSYDELKGRSIYDLIDELKNSTGIKE